MHVEYCHALGSLSVQIEGIEKADVERALKKSTVGIAPSSAPELFGTDFAFKLSTAINKKKTPQILASEIAELASSSNRFSIVSPGTGHLNAMPKELLVKEFQQVIKTGASHYFFAQGSVAKDEVFDSSFESFPSGDMLRNIYRQAEKSKNEDVRLLIETKSNRGMDFIVMLSALLSDRELNSYAYLNGLGGRENVPWFFKKFLSDAELFKRNNPYKNEALLVLSSEEMKIGPYDYRSALPKSLEEIAKGFLMELFSMRSVFLSSKAQGSPALWCGYLLDMVRRFYAFYNLPQYRVISTDRAADIEFIAPVVSYVSVVREIIECWFEQLSACEN